MINYQPTREDILTLIFSYSPGFNYNEEVGKHGCIKSNPYRGEYWEWYRNSFDNMSDENLVDFMCRLRRGEMVTKPDVSLSCDQCYYEPASLKLPRPAFPDLKKFHK